MAQAPRMPLHPVPLHAHHSLHLNPPSWSALGSQLKALLLRSPVLTASMALLGAGAAVLAYTQQQQEKRRRLARRRIVKLVKTDFKKYRLDILQYLSEQPWNHFDLAQLGAMYSAFESLLESPDAKRGIIPLSKLVGVLRAQGISSERVAHACAKFFDADGNWQVDFIELVERLNLLTHGSRARKLEALFQVYDLDGSGRISRGEMEEVVRALSHRDKENTEEAVKALFQSIDTDRNGHITLQEFLQLADREHVSFQSPAAGGWQAAIQKHFGLMLH